MLAHLRLARERRLHVVRNLAIPALNGHAAGDMREGALEGVGVVQPLREQAPVQRHHAGPFLRHRLLQALDEGGRQRPRRGDRGRGELLHEVRDLARAAVRAADLLLDLAENRVALVDAAHAVEVRAGHAVGRRQHVVRDDHLRAQGIRLVQRADDPQVALALRELVAPVQRGAVELVQWHPADLPLLDLGETVLQLQALLVRMQPVLVRQVFHDLRGDLKRRPLGAGPARHILANVPDPSPRRRPISEPLARLRHRLRHDTLRSRLRRVGARHVHDHVGVDDRLHSSLVGMAAVVADPGNTVGLAEARGVLLLREALQGRRQGRRLSQGEALAVEAAFKDLAGVAAALHLEHGRGRGGVPRVATIVEAADVPIARGREEAVQQIAGARG
mmetsp:Transcript_34560/g.98293  ORF Transcript_34560/g.98293 Transcript_34560/m.98293 type:complete len:390 (+) Transcript_34560:280-1449(+)